MVWFERSDGFYAVKFVGFENLKQTQQWLQMNLATNWMNGLRALKLKQYPINFVYADNQNNIGYVHNNVTLQRFRGSIGRSS